MDKDKEYSLKIVCFALGIVVPLATLLIMKKTGIAPGRQRKSAIDRAHDITVEDSFPASDPPSAW